jgi:hypothetical protein
MPHPRPHLQNRRKGGYLQNVTWDVAPSPCVFGFLGHIQEIRLRPPWVSSRFKLG